MKQKNGAIREFIALIRANQITETTSDFKMGVMNHQITCVVFLCNIFQKQTILRRKIIYDELRTFEIYILTLILGDEHGINFTSERIRRFIRVVGPK